MFSLQRVHQEFAEIQQMLSILLILEGPSRSVSGELAKFVPLLLPAGENVVCLVWLTLDVGRRGKARLLHE